VIRGESPTWLAPAYERLDAAVFDAYGRPCELTDERVLERLLALNPARSDGGRGSGPPPGRRRGDAELFAQAMSSTDNNAVHDLP